jgi:phosphohistidine swiveling domain-containing protein
MTLHLSYIYQPGNADISPTTAIGGKAFNLAVLARLKHPVPAWCAVTTHAFRVAIQQAGIIHALQSQSNAPALQKQIADLPLPQEIADAILAAYRSIATGQTPVAVRSSAADEDSANQSFAGLHDSYLFVRGEEAVLTAVKQVWASAFNERAIAYRQKNHLPLNDIAVGVVIQVMIDPSVSGVMFTANPVSGNVHETVISALFGAGEGLVSQGLDADTFTVAKADGSITTELVDKSEQMVADQSSGRGLLRIPVESSNRGVACMSDIQIRLLTDVGLAIERSYGRPQDIEFCFDKAGKLHILQTRPITTVKEYGPAAGHHLIWDNSNIIESYSGVTSPMTFSFIRRAYAIVYNCFCEVMGIPPKAHQDMFANMLGLFHGQVYYNLLNWYRLVRLFPGFNYNKEFMESMMGVKEPVELKAEQKPTTRFRKYFVELPQLIQLLLRSSRNFRNLPTLAAKFQNNFNEHYNRWAAMDFGAMKPHELAALYREMEARLLWNWKAPIINDFYVMIFYGTLKKLCKSWCGDEQGSLQNDLICGEGGIESTEPTRLLIELAGVAYANPALKQAILNTAADELVIEIPANPAFSIFTAKFAEYLDQYGFRCMNELKLEEYSLKDKPHFIYTVLRNYLSLDRPEVLDTRAIHEREQKIRRDAEQRAFASAGGLIKGPVFKWVVRNARQGVKNRENMRFARTKIYGLLRELIRALGRHFAKEGVLPDPEDIFYLTLDECFDYIRGTAVSTNLAGIASVRRAEFDVYRAEAERPDDRFETYGMAYLANLFKTRSEEVADTNLTGELRGIGCCPGEVTGIVKVLRTPKDDLKLSGEILVADRTDPGWVPLYPSVSGILIERGSILSHSAIVAREMGIPTIVGIPGLTAKLVSGQKVIMNGSSGVIQIIDQAKG